MLGLSLRFLVIPCLKQASLPNLSLESSISNFIGKAIERQETKLYVQKGNTERQRQAIHRKIENPVTHQKELSSCVSIVSCRRGNADVTHPQRYMSVDQAQQEAGKSLQCLVPGDTA